jgi:hypothetical protein
MATWRVGRNLKSEARTAELRQKVHKWKSTPKNTRQPRTLVAWAGEQGITVRMAYYLLAQSPEPNIQPIRQPHRSKPGRKLLVDLEQDERLQRAIATFGNTLKTGRTSTPQDGTTVPTVTSVTPVTPEKALQPDPVTPGHGWNCACLQCTMTKRIDAIIAEARKTDSLAQNDSRASQTVM